MIYLVGNKSDMDNREVSQETAIKMAKENGIHKVFETSAKTGTGVQELFSCCAKELFLINSNNDLQEDEIVLATPLDEKKLKVRKRICC